MIFSGKKYVAAAVVCVMVACLSVVSVSAASDRIERIKGAEVASGRFLVKFRSGVSKEAAKRIIQGKSFVQKIEGLFETTGNAAGKEGRNGVLPRRKRGSSLRQWYVIHLRAGISVENALSTLRAINEVETAEPDMLNRPYVSSNDPLLDNQWALNNIGQTGGLHDADVDGFQAWDIETGKADVIVAVVDTGIEYTHEDLLPNLWVNQAEANGQPYVDDDNNGCVDDVYGCDLLFSRNADGNYHGLGGAAYNAQANVGADPEFHRDSTGHGTHVAGIIGAVGNNGKGVSGVNWSVKLMAVKTYGKGGGGFTSANVRGIIYAVDNGARIINASWGHADIDGTQGSVHALLKDAIEYAQANDVLFVAGAGNDNLDIDQVPFYPASIDLDNILTVGGTDKGDQRYEKSNYGVRSVDISAPAVDILSTALKPGAGLSGIVDASGYALETGTSMAAPFVSGTAALMLAQNPSLSYRDLKERILASGDKLGQLIGHNSTASRLNVKRAVELAKVSTTLHAVATNYSGGSSVSVPLELVNNDSAAGLQFDLIYSGDVFDLASVTANQNITSTHTVTWSEVPAYEGSPTIFDMDKRAARVVVSPNNQSNMSISSGVVGAVSLDVLGGSTATREAISFKNVVVSNVQSSLIGAVAYDGTISNVSATDVSSGGTLSGTASENLRLLNNGAYVIANDFVVPRGLSLTIEAGADIRLESGASIQVNGSINVAGTQANPVRFSGAGSNPTKGSWTGIVINDVDSQSAISHAIIQHAEKGIAVNVGNPSISNVGVSNNVYGIYIYGHSAPVISGSNITQNDYGVYLEGDENDDYMNPRPLIKRNNIFSNASYNYYAAAFYNGWGVHLSAIENWWGTTDVTTIQNLIYDNNDEQLASPYVEILPFLDAKEQLTTGNALFGQLQSDVTIPPNSIVTVTGNVTVPAGIKLVVGEGATLRFASLTRISVAGTLQVKGTEANPVLFTSDSATPAKGDWSGIRLTSADSQSSLENLSIRYASYAVSLSDTSITLDRVNISDATNGITLQNNSDAVISNSNIEASGAAIIMYDSSPHLFGNFITGAYHGIFIYGASNPLINGANVITNNRYGLYIYSSRTAGGDPMPTITNNSIFENAAYDLRVRPYYDENVVINAQGNWWGSVDANEVESNILDGSDYSGAGYPLVSYGDFLSTGPGMPTIVAQLNPTVVSGATETLDASGSSSIHGIVSYSWEQITGPAVTIEGASSSVASYTVPNVGLLDNQLEFKITVQDSIGRISSQVLPVQVALTAGEPIVLGGVLNSDTVLESGKIYHVTSTLYAPPGVTLTINPGAIIKVADATSIKIRGAVLNMLGTAEEPIVFDYLEDSGAWGYWYGITIEPWTGGSTLPVDLKHAIINRAVNGITVWSFEVNMEYLEIYDSKSTGISYYSNAYGTIADTIVKGVSGYPIGIYISDSSPTLERNIVVDNWYGVYLYGSASPIIYNGNILTGNAYGIYLNGSGTALPYPVINNNSIYGNTSMNMRSSVSSDVVPPYVIDATSNFWNLPDAASVKNTIRDYEDGWSITTINVDPVLQTGSMLP